MQEKKDLRIEMLSKRDAIDREQKKILDRSICENIDFLITQDQDAIRVVHAFIPLEKEINILPVLVDLLDRGVTVVCPKALPKRKMENLVLTSLNKLEEGIYGTKHPASNKIYTGKIDLIIIPGLAFDNEGYRLGYGSGYYDAFLSAQTDAFKLGICYPFQVVDKVPTEEHDVKLDGLFY